MLCSLSYFKFKLILLFFTPEFNILDLTKFISILVSSTVVGLNIADKYADIERQLIESFKQAYFDGNLQRMKNISDILSNFKVGYLLILDFIVHI